MCSTEINIVVNIVGHGNQIRAVNSLATFLSNAARVLGEASSVNRSGEGKRSLNENLSS